MPSTLAMHPLIEMLKGGDRRSIGRANEVVALVLKDPMLLAVLFFGMQMSDPVVAMRCADVAEKITAKHPEYLLPYKRVLLKTLGKIGQAEVRWHVAPMLARLPLSKAEQRAVVNLLMSYMTDKSSIVKTFAMQALCDLGLRYTSLRATTIQHIKELMAVGTPAMQARGKKLLVKLEQTG